MGWISNLRKVLRGDFSFDAKTAWTTGALGGNLSASGMNVSANRAMNVAAVFACIRVLGNTLGSLPLHVYKRQNTGLRSKAIDRTHPVYNLLHDEAYPPYGMGSGIFIETLMTWLALYGNAYALVHRSGRRKIVGLQPFHPDGVSVDVVNGDIRYTLKTANGSVDWPRSEMIHVKAFTLDGIKGVSPITYARDSLGSVLAMDLHQSKLMANGARPGGVIEHPAALDPKVAEDLRKSWNQAYGGVENTNKVAVLEQGMKYHSLSMSPADTQFLESRRFGIEEITRWFWNVPPHLISEMSHATFTNIEHQAISFVQNVVRPLCVRFEAEFNRVLFTGAEANTYFAEFVLDGLIRGDTASRYQAYATAINWGWMCPNDVRDLENQNPIEGGDQHLVPLNMQPMSMVAENVKIKPTNDGDAKTRSIEARMARRAKGVTERRRLRDALRPVVQDAMRRIVKAEIRDARKKIGARSLRYSDKGDFDIWLDNFYSTFGETARAQMQSALAAVAEAIGPVAAEEAGGETPLEKVKEFLSSYLDVFAMRYPKKSMEQLQQSESMEDVDAMLADWEETRGDEQGDTETVRFSEGLTKTVFGALGITKLIWVANAGACPICSELDGQTVGIEQFFIGAGGSIGGSRVGGNIGHPPLHKGCQCNIVVGI